VVSRDGMETVRIRKILCFVDRASRYNRVKKTHLDAQLILSIFRQPLHVSGVSRPMIRRYNQSNQDNSHLKRLISINCYIHRVVPPDDGPRYAQNM